MISCNIFFKICLEDVIIIFLTDDKRKKELCNSRDMEMRVGDSFGMNCLADSLLQCLSFHNMIDATQEDISDVHWRRRLCAAAREFLCQQSDDWLRPRQKDEHNGIRTVAQDEHDKAFLEHQRHAKVIVMYFLDNFGKTKVQQTRGIRLLVFSRFDDDDITPDDLVINIYADHLSSLPPLDIFLYNTTGKQTTGYQYDPVFFLDRRKRPRLTPDSKTKKEGITQSSQPKVLPASSMSNVKSKRLEGLQKQIPTYLNAVDPFRRTCESAVCTSGCDKQNKQADMNNDTNSKSELDDFIADAIPMEEEYNGFYTVRGYDFKGSPDKLRDELEQALHTLSLLFREHPTLPADHSDLTKPLQEALSEECGLLLPCKHCAFNGCGWTGNDAITFTQHINEKHKPALESAVQAYKALKPVHHKDEIILALSMYNEGIPLPSVEVLLLQVIL